MFFSSDEKKPFTCVIYTRISDQERKEVSDSDTIESQREICESFVKTRENWKLLPVRYDDRNYSGGTLDRPAFKRLLADAKQGKFNMIIVKAVDRFSRDLHQFFQVQPELERLGVHLSCASQSFSTNDATGRLILQILLSFAEFERRLACERTRDRMRFRAKNGLFHGGYPPLGYSFDPDPVRKGHLVIDRKEAKLAKEIFDRYLKIQSAHLVAKYLNERGYRTKVWTTKDGHSRGGGRFTEGMILGILKSPTYIGKTFTKSAGPEPKYEYYPAKWKPIIQVKTFDKAQKILKLNSQTRSSISENKYKLLLSGLIQCGCCKSRMTPNYSLKKGRPYLYYQCTRVAHTDKNACRIKSTPARELENLVIERLKFLSTQKPLIEGIVKTAMKQSKNKLPGLLKQKKELLGKLGKIKTQSGPLLAHRNLSIVMEKLQALEDQKTGLEKHLQDVNSQIDRENIKVLNPELIAQNLVRFRDVFDALGFENQRDLLHVLIKQIVYNEDPAKIRVILYDLPEIKMPPEKPRKGSSGGSAPCRFDMRPNWLP